MTYTIAGITRDSNGNALPNCVVLLFKQSDKSYQTATRSDASGNYSFTVADITTPYFVVSINALVGDSALVGWWRFDEGSNTTANDSSGNNNTGTLINVPTWVIGKYGKALSFDGTDDYVFIYDSASLYFGDSLTIAAWINLAAFTGSYRTVYHCLDGDLYITNGGKIYGDLYLAEIGWVDVTGVTTMPLSGWVFVVFTYDKNLSSNNLKVYFNSVIDGQSTHIGTPRQSAGSRRIGSDGGSWFNGLIDELRIYNRALTQTEIANLYNNPPSVVGTSDNNLYGV